ncbi:hypothetical protein F9874_09940 [Glaesserella parasuis]|uniref:Pili assembly chaperone C-terminal domain-containing protein n=1 Tax=Glaesserella parasuis TaxID=738 RepID=A0A859IFN9_GLAPU|nr:hypothetical protein [Glaesserella parasuis]MWP84424.1 hypothetical protein [Glaesserella parasuis]MWP86385.1 hypothetical protein [Glaesserella parasuis]MWP96581.1 hypothetical protein [Glaesserella parasuis]MWQ00552.1 hypothetical protein [Glaesserella parasuis]
MICNLLFVLVLSFSIALLSLSPYDAYQSVQWLKTAKGVVVDNQTPYFITYQSVKLGNAYLPNSEMVAPFSSKTLILKGKVSGSRVNWEAINDFGGTEKGEAVLR